MDGWFSGAKDYQFLSLSSQFADDSLVETVLCQILIKVNLSICGDGDYLNIRTKMTTSIAICQESQYFMSVNEDEVSKLKSVLILHFLSTCYCVIPAYTGYSRDLKCSWFLFNQNSTIPHIIIQQTYYIKWSFFLFHGMRSYLFKSL